MNIRKLSVLLIVAAVLVSLAIYHWKPMPYYERLIRIQAEQELGRIDERITQEPLDIQTVLLDYSYSGDKELTLQTWIALSKYRESTRRIIRLYGSEQEFKDILRTYGDSVIPAIQYFLDNDVKSLLVMQAARAVIVNIGGGVNRIWNRVTGNAPLSPSPDAQVPFRVLGPTERGWYAVNFIKNEGHLFLGEFVMGANNVPEWIQTQRFTNALTSFFTSGVRSLETKHALDEKITAVDIFFAGADVIPLAASIKLLRAGKVVVASGEELSLLGRTRAFATRLIPKGAFFKSVQYGAVIATAYIVVTHPSLVSSLLGEMAKLFGLNPLLVEIVGWFLLVIIALYPFLWALKALVKVILFGLSLIEKSHKQVARKRLPSSPVSAP